MADRKYRIIPIWGQGYKTVTLRPKYEKKLPVPNMKRRLARDRVEVVIYWTRGKKMEQ